jgi:ribosome modulation factor
MNTINTVLPDVKLKFHIDHPSLEDCYAFGYECAQAQISEDENPFPENSASANQWLEGWWDGFYDEAPLYDTVAEQSSETIESEAANDQRFQKQPGFFYTVLKITGAIAASAVVGYQVIDLVA